MPWSATDVPSLVFCLLRPWCIFQSGFFFIVQFLNVAYKSFSWSIFWNHILKVFSLSITFMKPSGLNFKEVHFSLSWISTLVLFIKPLATGVFCGQEGDHSCSAQPYTHVQAGSTRQTLGFWKGTRNWERKEIGGLGVGVRFYKNILYACMKFSRSENDTKIWLRSLWLTQGRLGMFPTVSTSNFSFRPEVHIWSFL